MCHEAKFPLYLNITCNDQFAIGFCRRFKSSNLGATAAATNPLIPSAKPSGNEGGISVLTGAESLPVVESLQYCGVNLENSHTVRYQSDRHLRGALEINKGSMPRVWPLTRSAKNQYWCPRSDALLTCGPLRRVQVMLRNARVFVRLVRMQSQSLSLSYPGYLAFRNNLYLRPIIFVPSLTPLHRRTSRSGKRREPESLGFQAGLQSSGWSFHGNP
jgi:hypothetical protein